MLIVLKQKSTQAERDEVIKLIREQGYEPREIPGSLRTAIGITGNQGPLSPELFDYLPQVVRCVPVTRPYKLISRETHPGDSLIRLGDVEIGGAEPVLVAGPCSVEKEDSLLRSADKLAERGIKIFRAGAYKPRTSPYSFQGLREEGLELLGKVKEKTGMKIITEAVDIESLPKVSEFADIVQIGARNMYHYSLLKRVGELNKPVLLKRGLSATLEEFFMAAEYIVSHGNYQVILCERGIRTYSDYSRNTLDINVVPAIKEISHLPVIVDPSHASGARKYVAPLALAAVAAGADGIMVEAHYNPETAISDGAQSLYPAQISRLYEQIRKIKKII